MTQDMLHKYGYPEGCEACSYKLPELRETRNHSAECKTRI